MVGLIKITVKPILSVRTEPEITTVDGTEPETPQQPKGILAWISRFKRSERA